MATKTATQSEEYPQIIPEKQKFKDSKAAKDKMPMIEIRNGVRS